MSLTVFLMAPQRNDLYTKWGKLFRRMPDFSRWMAGFCSTFWMTPSHPIRPTTKFLKNKSGLHFVVKPWLKFCLK